MEGAVLRFSHRTAFALSFAFAAAGAAWGVTYSTNPAATTAGAATLTLEISRTITGTEEGFSPDEMATFQWLAPGSASAVSLPRATFVSPVLVRVTIDTGLLNNAGTARIQYTADPSDTRELRTISFTINARPTITTFNLPAATRGAPYQFPIGIVDGTPPFRWTLIFGSLPPGITLSPSGTLSGTPTATGAFTFSVRVADSFDVTDQRTLTLTIAEPGGLTISTVSPLPNAKLGIAYSQTLAAIGGKPPYTWAIASGSLPGGMTLNPSTGVVSGTAAGSGAFQFTARVTDSAAAAATKVFALTVDIPLVSCTISPQNSFLQLHRPEFHTVGGHPDHTLKVRVAVDGNSAGLPPIAVSLTATRVVFAPPSGAATAANTSVTTNAAGEAGFIVNPPMGVSFDSTQLTARGTLNAQPFECSGSIVTGAGAISAIAQQQIQTVLLTSLFDQQYERDYGRFATEVADIVRGRPELQIPGARLLQRVEASRAGRKSRLTAAELRQFDAVLRTIAADGSPELRTAIARWRRDLTQTRLRVVAAKKPMPPAPPPAVVATNAAAFPNLRLSFEPNRGQAPPGIRFTAHGGVKNMSITRSGVKFSEGLEMQIAGARLDGLAPDEPLPARSHYLIGESRRTWRIGVPHYGKLRARGVYPGTDIVFYGDQGRLRYDFVLAPGAEPRNIRLRFQGAAGIEFGAAGELILQHRAGNVRMEAPVVYQDGRDGRQLVACRYVSRGRNLVGFDLGDYDRTRNLVIDPVLAYSTYLGGSIDDAGMAVAVDAQGSAYIAGTTSSPDFPGKSAPDRRAHGTFITKLTPDGTGIVYSTYIGGDGPVIASGIAVDGSGNAYVCGLTTATNFPLVQPFQTSLGDRAALPGGDAFVLKLNAAGSDLIYSTYIGGSKIDIAKSVAVDAAGNAYVAGATASADFPVRGGFQSALRGGRTLATDAFLLKLNSAGSALTYSTYLGGTGDDYANAVAVDAAGNAYVAGMTYSTDFPVRSKLQTGSAGSFDAFVAKVNAAGSALVYSTYLGGESDDQAMAIAVDAAGSAYVAGMTGSAKFPVVAPAQGKPGATNAAGFDAFVSKLAPDGNSLVYSTYLGGSGTDMAQGIVLGPDNSAYVVGETDSADFPLSAPVTPGGGSSDAFVARLNPSGAAFEYTTRIGGSGLDTGAAIALDRSGNVYVAGSSFSPDMAVTYGVYQAGPSGLSDAIALKIAAGTPPPFLSIKSAAALVTGQPGAPLAVMSAFGTKLAPRSETAQPPLGKTLAGVSVNVRDSAGAARAADLYLAAPDQIRFVVPAETALGLAEITVQAGDQVVARATLRIETVSPGLFSANQDGKGPAFALALRGSPDGPQTSQSTYTCAANNGPCTNLPIEVGTDDPVYLQLFGTGIRRRTSLDGVTVTIGGQPAPVTIAGDQGDYPGYDQVVVGPLPASLSGLGTVDVRLTVDGKEANAVTVALH